MKFWAWFDVHRATLWQMVAASLLMGGVTFAAIILMGVARANLD